MKKNIFCLISALLICSCNNQNVSSEKVTISLNEDVTSEKESVKEEISLMESNGFDGIVNGISFKLPDLGNDVKIHSQLQDQYLNGDYNDIFDYANGDKELSFPVEIDINCEVSGNTTSNFSLLLSEDKDFTKVITRDSTSSSFRLVNLKVDTKYYYKVKVDGIESKVASFKTQANGPRNMRIDGVNNFRDVGGWKTSDGQMVKQGLIYRCGALSMNKTGTRMVTNEGIRKLQELGIKSEIDLRGAYENENGGISESPIGKNVNYFHIPMIYDNLLVNNHEQVAKVFKILANKDNYPLLIHCAGGTDRTGMMAYLINALCGVSESDLYKDYLFTNFYHSNDPRDLNSILKNNYVETIKKEEGNTLILQVYNAL